jgi:hypothetical protein
LSGERERDKRPKRGGGKRGDLLARIIDIEKEIYSRWHITP